MGYGTFWSEPHEEQSEGDTFNWHSSIATDYLGSNFNSLCEEHSLAFSPRAGAKLGIQELLAQPKINRGPIVVFGRTLLNRGVSFRPARSDGVLDRVPTHMLVSEASPLP